MIAGPQVRVSVRITPENQARLRQEAMRLAFLVGFGSISEDDAKSTLAALNLQLTEYRKNGGEWRPLAEA